MNHDLKISLICFFVSWLVGVHVLKNAQIIVMTTISTNYEVGKKI